MDAGRRAGGRGFREAAWNAGGQIDYETLRFYTSLRTALLLRLFRKSAWLEAGATTDGEVRAMAMFNF